jgi:hypothetical protein
VLSSTDGYRGTGSTSFSATSLASTDNIRIDYLRAAPREAYA